MLEQYAVLDAPPHLFMSLTVGQIVYTSFPKLGFGVYSSGDVPPDIQHTLVKHIVHANWDPYDPPPAQFRAVFVQQVSLQQTLFGWLINDGCDDLGRAHVPYCLGYYLNQPLDMHLFDAICTCLAHGPAQAVSRHCVPDMLEPIQLPNTYDYEPSFQGLEIMGEECDRNLRLIENNHFVEVFTSVQPNVTPTDVALTS